MKVSTGISYGRSNRFVNPDKQRDNQKAFDRIIHDSTLQGLLLVYGDLKKYPRRHTGSTYRRTKTLGRSWTYKVFDRMIGVIGRVGSSGQIAPYNKYVQAARFQAIQHKRIWKNTDQFVVNTRRKDVLDIYARNIRNRG